MTAAGNTDSTRMKGMAGVAGALKTKALAEQSASAVQGLGNGINADSLKGVGTTRIQATWGTSKSQSNSSSYTEVNQGSSIDTNNLALIATGAGTDSNININGSSLTVSKDVLLQADNDLNINGVAQNSNTRSDNKSSSAAIGGFADTNGSAGITASASRAKGYANSDSTTYANSQINVGGNTTLDIGNDFNGKGVVFNTNKVQGVIGGDMTIESLQDTATYDSDQKNMGFSADIDIAGAGSSLSVNGGKTNVNADYQAVGEQSELFTGDGGFDLTTEGKTTLIGGAITTTEEALAAGRNNYESLGGIITQDIENTTSYKGDAIQVGVSLGMTDKKPQGNTNGLGYGTDSDSDSSITKAGITGIAGHSDITTDNREEYAGALENVFDANRVNEELGAQVEITQAFDQERRKIKTELNAKEQKLRDEAEEALKNGDNRKATEKFAAADKVQNRSLLFDSVTGAIYAPNVNGISGYAVKAASPYVARQIGDYYKTNEVLNDIDKGYRRERGGAGHLLAHPVLGAAVSYATGNDVLTGGLSAGAGEATAPILSKFLYDTEDPNELTAEQKDTISAITGVVVGFIGVTTGSTSNAANSAETSVVAVEDNWDEVGHYYMTYIAALEGGFSNANAQKIATAAWAPDTDSRNAMGYKSLAQSLLIAPFDVFRGDKRKERNQPTIHALGVDAGITLYEQQERIDKLEKERTAARAKTVALFAKIAKAQDKGKSYNLTKEDENLLHISGDLYGHDNDGVGFPEGVGHLYPGAKQDDPNYKNTTKNFKTYAENIRYAANWSNERTRGVQSTDYKKLLTDITSTSDKATQIKYLENYAKKNYGIKQIQKPKEDGAFK